MTHSGQSEPKGTHNQLGSNEGPKLNRKNIPSPEETTQLLLKTTPQHTHRQHIHISDNNGQIKESIWTGTEYGPRKSTRRSCPGLGIHMLGARRGYRSYHADILLHAWRRSLRYILSMANKLLYAPQIHFFVPRSSPSPGRNNTVRSRTRNAESRDDGSVWVGTLGLAGAETKAGGNGNLQLLRTVHDVQQSPLGPRLPLRNTHPPRPRPKTTKSPRAPRQRIQRVRLVTCPSNCS